ncbi:MAG: DUF3999 family protein, partial [Myxococcota bacterium]
MRLAVLFSVLALSTSVGAADTVPEDYAYGMEMDPSDSPVQSGLLPIDFYRGVTTPGAIDSQVFDSQGAAVPFAVRSLVGRSRPPKRVPLAVFPIQAPEDQNVQQLDLTVERSESGSIASVSVQSESDTNAGAVLRGYLLDLAAVGASKQRAEFLELSAPETKEGFITSVRLEQSDDLSNWQPIVYDQTLAHIDYGGKLLERRRIPLNLMTADYMRLSWRDGASEPKFSTITVGLSSGPAVPQRMEIAVTGTKLEGETQSFEFDLGGPVPIDRLNLLSLQENTIGEVQWWSRSTPDEEWQRSKPALVYNVTIDGVSLRNRALSIRATRDRYWKLEVDGKGGGLGSASPMLEAQWVPEQLLFMRRGDAPFTLAFGSARVDAERFE